MNKGMLFLVNLVVTVSYSFSSSPSQKSQKMGLPISASSAELAQVYNVSSLKPMELNQGRNTSSTSAISSSSGTKDPSPELVVSIVQTEKNTPDFDQRSYFMRTDVIQKFCEYYRINGDPVEQSNYFEAVHIADTLDFYVEIFYENAFFEKAGYKDLLAITNELQKYDGRKRWRYGSMIVDRENEKILEDEHKKIEELRKKGSYSLVHGSVSRFEQRQQYLQERKEFLEKLIKKSM